MTDSSWEGKGVVKVTPHLSFFSFVLTTSVQCDKGDKKKKKNSQKVKGRDVKKSQPFVS